MFKVINDENADEKETLDFYSDMEVDVLARTIWGEAHSQGNEGMEAIAHVILNRVTHAEEKGRFWWGNNIIQVCQRPYQFSCWNRKSQDFLKLSNVNQDDESFKSALEISKRFCVGETDNDPTKGATHYHANDVHPYWAKDEEPVATIGNHVFYRVVE